MNVATQEIAAVGAHLNEVYPMLPFTPVRGSGVYLENAAGRVLEIHARAAHRSERQHRIDLVQMRADGGDLLRCYVHHSHPAAGAVRPVVSGQPSNLLAH